MPINDKEIWEQPFLIFPRRASFFARKNNIEDILIEPRSPSASLGSLYGPASQFKVTSPASKEKDINNARTEKTKERKMKQVDKITLDRSLCAKMISRRQMMTYTKYQHLPLTLRTRKSVFYPLILNTLSFVVHPPFSSWQFRRLEIAFIISHETFLCLKCWSQSDSGVAS